VAEFLIDAGADVTLLPSMPFYNDPDYQDEVSKKWRRRGGETAPCSVFGELGAGDGTTGTTDLYRI
jgi:hypothetical protein